MIFVKQNSRFYNFNICYDTILQVWWCYNNNKIKMVNEDPEKFKDKLECFNRI